MFKKIAISSILIGSLTYVMGSADININDNTLQVGVEYNLNNSYNLSQNSNYLFTANYLRSENNAVGNTQTLTSVGVKIVNPYVDDYGFSLGLGVKGLVADNSEKTFVAAPLGIFASYMINDRFHIDGEIDYAPKVLSFSDGDSYKEWNAKVNYKVIDNGYVYVGGRSIKTSYTDGYEFSYDKTLFFGFKVNY